MKNEMPDAFDEEKKYRTKLPSNFYRTVLELLNQGLMAPSYLSRLVMLIILPSQ